MCICFENTIDQNIRRNIYANITKSSGYICSMYDSYLNDVSCWRTVSKDMCAAAVLLVCFKR